MIKSLGIGDGSEVTIELDPISRQITIRPLEVSNAGADENLPGRFLNLFRNIVQH